MKRKSIAVSVGRLVIGGGNPVVIQSMTDTDTSDVENTLKQVKELINAGSEMVRITVNTEPAAKSVPDIIKKLRDKGFETPIIGDFHFNGTYLLKNFPEMAELIDKYRINPGTTGKIEYFDEFIKIAIDNDKPIRIGVNWGSVERNILNKKIEENSKRKKPRGIKEVMVEAIVESVIYYAERAKNLGLSENKIIVSAKVSEVPELVKVYRELAEKTPYPLHLGLTEAGSSIKGIVSSAIGIGSLLLQGIGDTIRVSVTPRPGESRTREVEIAKEILQSLNLRRFHPEVISCPGCGRTNSDLFKKIAERIKKYLKERQKEWEEIYPDFKNLKIAVMGCVVNGPGESKFANIGLCLPGIGEEKSAIYVNGEFKRTVKIEEAEEELKREIEDYLIG